MSRLIFQNFRRLSSVKGGAIEWLVTFKGFDPVIAEGIVKSFPSSPSIKDIQQLGEVGLKSLVDAIIREQRDTAQAEYVPIHVDVPHAGLNLRLTAMEGDSLYSLSRRNPVLAEFMECACNGIAACTTCHVYVEKERLLSLVPPAEDELDVIDYAWGVSDNSRLGCQIKLTKDCRDIRFTIPESTNNLF